MRAPAQMLGASGGAQFPHVELEEQLEHREWGDVYRGLQTSLGRPCLVKRLDPTRADATATRRFGRDAKRSAQLDHPGLIEVFATGTDSDGAPYAIMELLKGYDLQTVIERYGPMPANRAINVLCDLCDILEFLHGHFTHITHNFYLVSHCKHSEIFNNSKKKMVS